MRSIQYSHVFQMFILGFSICGAFFVVFDVTYIAPKVVKNYDIIMKPPPLKQARAEFNEEFGYWARTRQTLYVSFVIPPIIGFALAIALRQHIRNLLIKNKRFLILSRDMRRPLLRWDGLGFKELRLKELRKDLSILPQLFSILPQFLPLGTVIIILFLFESLVFPGRWTSVPVAFLATCGFISYGTWKRIFAEATSFESSDRDDNADARG